MLTHLHINNFTLVDSLDIELHEGLTTLTGETGAGKSILLDALALTLGDRTDSDKVRAGKDRADIHASFDLSNLKHAQKWLKENDLGSESECILRRVITKEGRSRAYINGQTVPLNQLRTLGEMLIDIHSQHEHQSLLKTNTHRRILDEYAGLENLAKQVKQLHREWSAVTDKLLHAQNRNEESDARYQLLSYQVDELNQMELEENELEQLEAEQRILANAGSAIQNCQHALTICNDEESGILEQLHKALHLINDIPEPSENLKNVESLLNSALISIEEAESDLSHHINNFEADPERLGTVEQRLSDIYNVARKHKVAPEELVSLHTSLSEELDSLQTSDELIESLEAEQKALQNQYQEKADSLTQKRSRAAKKLAKQVNSNLAQLAMAHASLAIELIHSDTPTLYGNESVEFRISTQPGQPAKPLHKIASGGELSRVSLAIQVVAAQNSATPTLVFDEVDVGIGGTVGDVVGKMLRELGASGQVLCVTHLAQVASKAHTHLRVEKTLTKSSASSSLHQLDKEEKVEEIARMMGGMVDSIQSLAHAREILNAA